MNGGNVMRRVFAFHTGPVMERSRKARRDAPRTPHSAPSRKLIVAAAKEDLPAPPLLMTTAAAAAPRKLTVVRWPVAPQRVEDAPRRDPGRRLGIAACVCVGAWWLNSALDLVASALFPAVDTPWSRLALPLLFVALLGSHVLAILASAAYGSRDPWGPRAVTAFWASILLWVPLGTVVALIQQIAAG